MGGGTIRETLLLLSMAANSKLYGQNLFPKWIYRDVGSTLCYLRNLDSGANSYE